MTKIFFTILIIAGIIWITACNKNDGPNNATAIVGSWKYVSSTIGGGSAAQTRYDSLFVTNIADTLEFTANSIVYYKYLGLTTWSHYKVPDFRLILIGGVKNDTLIIHELNDTQLQLGILNSYYKATLKRL